MVKRIFLTLLQFLAFGALLVVGAFWAFVRIFCPPLAFIPVWRYQVGANYYFVANGVVLAAALLAILLLVETLRKTLRPWGTLTALAFLLAVLVSLAMKLGFLTAS